LAKKGKEVAAMFFVGVDYHRRYSFASGISGDGRTRKECLIEGNSPGAFGSYFESLGQPARVVIEAGRGWDRLYEILSEIDEVEEVVLAHPYSTRLIAEAQIKTDKLDARVLARLLRAGFIARAHIPSRWARDLKDLMRQRTFWVIEQTRVKNRVHILLDRQVNLERPHVSDLFGLVGMKFLEGLELAEPQRLLLKQDLQMLAELKAEIRRLDRRVYARSRDDDVIKSLESVPGVGKVLANVIAAEIDEISRFKSADKLAAYCGLVPRTVASGGKVYHGRLLSRCNKWLKWAFIEAAWASLRTSPYFSSLYRRHRTRGKASNKAIVIVARRLSRVVWHVLKEGREYRERYSIMKSSPVALVQD
jgi:transposase